MRSLIALLKSSAQADRIERTQHPRGLITVALLPSKFQRGIETSALLISAAVLAFSKLPIWLIALGWLALAAYAGWRKKKFKNPYVEMQLLPDDQIALRRQDEKESTAARIAGRAFVSPAVVAFRIAGERSSAVVLTPDQIPAAQFRALRVRLKHLREPSEMVDPR
jgi:hypothetical protein